MLERIQRNISRKFVGEAGSRLVSFAFNLVLAQGLGKAAYGRYSYAYAFAGVIAMCGELGLNTVLTREVAAHREEAPKFLAAFAPLRLLSVSLVAALTLVIALLSAAPDRFVEIAVMAVFMAANTLLDYQTAVLNAFERMGAEAGMRIATRVSVSVGGIVAVLLGAPLVPVMAAASAGNLLAAIGAGILRKRLGLSWPAKWDGAFAKRTLFTAIPVAAAWFGIVLYFYMDTLVLQALGVGDAAIGQYGAASKILEAAQGVPLIVVGGIFPIVAEVTRQRGSSAAAPYFTNASRLCLLAGAPLAAIGALLSPPVARLLYGPEFNLTGPALSLLALAAPFFFSNLIAVYLLLAMNHRWQAALFRGAACVLKAVLIGVFVKATGIVGAAAAMLVTDALLFVAMLVYRRAANLSAPGELGLIASVSLVSAVASGAYLFCISRGLVLQLAAVGAVFALGYLLLRRRDPNFHGLARPDTGAV